MASRVNPHGQPPPGDRAGLLKKLPIPSEIFDETNLVVLLIFQEGLT